MIIFIKKLKKNKYLVVQYCRIKLSEINIIIKMIIVIIIEITNKSELEVIMCLL